MAVHFLVPVVVVGVSAALGLISLIGFLTMQGREKPLQYEQKKTSSDHVFSNTRGHSSSDLRHRTSNKQKTRSKQRNKCSVCKQSMSHGNSYPCNHSGVCAACVENIKTDGDGICPECKGYIAAI